MTRKLIVLFCFGLLCLIFSITNVLATPLSLDLVPGSLAESATIEGDGTLQLITSDFHPTDSGWANTFLVMGYAEASSSIWVPWDYYDSEVLSVKYQMSAYLTLNGDPGDQGDVTVSWRNSLFWLQYDVIGNIKIIPTPAYSGAAAKALTLTGLVSGDNTQFGGAPSLIEQTNETYLWPVFDVDTETQAGSYWAGTMTVGDTLWIAQDWEFEVLAQVGIGGSAQAQGMMFGRVDYSLSGASIPPLPPDIPTPPNTPIGPVPEPGTVFLLSLGLTGLAGFRRKFKRESHF